MQRNVGQFNATLNSGYTTNKDMYLQSQYSEIDDNISSVIFNYENLASLISNNQNQGPAPHRNRHRQAHATNPRQSERGDHGGPGAVGQFITNMLAGTQVNPSPMVHVRDNRSNLSSTLYDFIRENNHGGGGQPGGGHHNQSTNLQSASSMPHDAGRNNRNRAHNQQISQQLENTGLDIDTEIDFLETQQRQIIYMI